MINDIYLFLLYCPEAYTHHSDYYSFRYSIFFLFTQIIYLHFIKCRKMMLIFELYKKYLKIKKDEREGVIHRCCSCFTMNTNRRKKQPKFVYTFTYAYKSNAQVKLRFLTMSNIILFVIFCYLKILVCRLQHHHHHQPKYVMEKIWQFY